MFVMVVYVVGFGVGIIFGSYIEFRFVIGYIIFLVNFMIKNEELINCFW